MKFDDTFISSGNLLTCCAYTLLDMADSDPYREVKDGMEVRCKYSGKNPNHRLVLLNGVWRWVDPASAEAEERDRLRKRGGLWDAIRGRNRD